MTDLTQRFDEPRAAAAADPPDLDALWADLSPVTVCGDDAGQLCSNLAAGGGAEASLWAVEFRGETTATMVYDAMPVFDHFKRVDDATLMGIMNGKLEEAFGVTDLYYFWLEQDA